jgi:CYTH domain-containing protein
MNNISEPERYRSFLIDKLPEPITRASGHLQIIDRYIATTAVRLRRVRDPSRRAVNHFIQKSTIIRTDGVSLRRSDEIHLSESEYLVFDRFIEAEIRKNRYFHEFDRRLFIFDIYLGELSGLGIVRADFIDMDEMQNFEPPQFTVLEVTAEPFFDGQNLVGQSFSSITAEVERLGHLRPVYAGLKDR